MIMNQTAGQGDIDFHMQKSSPESFVNGFGDNPLWLVRTRERDALQAQLTAALSDDKKDEDAINSLSGQLATAQAKIVELNEQIAAAAENAELGKLKAAGKTIWQFILQVIGKE
jgi:hypothetical protein